MLYEVITIDPFAIRRRLRQIGGDLEQVQRAPGIAIGGRHQLLEHATVELQTPIAEPALAVVQRTLLV